MIGEAAEVVVGLDLGTSGLKGVAVRTDGSIAARAEASYVTRRAAPGMAEQEPTHWKNAVHSVLSELADRVAPQRWRALGLAAMVPTLVLLDGSGGVLGPAITWEDARAEGQGERLRELVGAQTLVERTGHWIDGRYLLPMFMRIREEDPIRASLAAEICGAKDYVFRLLTGERATDPSTAAGFGCFAIDTGVWDPGVRSLAGLDETQVRLPELRPSTSVSPLAPELARDLRLPRELPVCLGAADSVLAARGIGATEPGDVAYVAGTSTVILQVSEHPRLDPQHRYLVTPMAEADRWGLEMDLVSTGSSIRWLASLLGLDRGAEDRVWDLAGAADQGASGITFLPYLGPGEQGALWDPSLQGCIVGLTLAHGPGDLARALLDGIVVESCRCLGVLEELGARVGVIRVNGKGATKVFRQALADSSGRTVSCPGGPNHPASAWGAASLGWSAIGAAPPAPRDDPGVPLTRPLRDPHATAIWQQTWDRYERTRLALKPIMELP